jgi:adenine-specific DNA-methyltransferase
MTLALTDPPPESPHAAEDRRYLQQQLITCIGNKRSLLPLIGRGVEVVRQRVGRDRLVCADLFSGSGVVSRYLKRFSSHLLANDLEHYSQIINTCYLTNPSDTDRAELESAHRTLLAEIEASCAPGFITELYSPADETQITACDRAFYTRANAMYLDTARQAIARLPERLQPLFLGPLLSRASVHANTAGVLKGFYKNAAGVGQFGGSGRDALSRIRGQITLDSPVLSRFECDYQVARRDANVLVKSLETIDLAYIDPPYNQHPYGSNYFMLNLLADYVRPAAISRVSGIPVGWQRSRYNQRHESEQALLELIAACPAKFVLVSYNSEGFVPRDRLIERLQRLGRLITLETPYATFRGSRNLRARELSVVEYLFVVEK